MSTVVKTQIRYYTKSGSCYVRTLEGSDEVWHKERPDGVRFDLAGGMHLTRRRLQRLITDYPINALDRTACFSAGVAREFFEDAKRENAIAVAENEESTIFFLLERGLAEYGIGYSSRVERIERLP